LASESLERGKMNWAWKKNTFSRSNYNWVSNDFGDYSRDVLSALDSIWQEWEVRWEVLSEAQWARHDEQRILMKGNYKRVQRQQTIDKLPKTFLPFCHVNLICISRNWTDLVFQNNTSLVFLDKHNGSATYQSNIFANLKRKW
jgi:hypothetical protein